MAAERRLKQIYFNIEDPVDRRRWEWANENILNFSDWGKKHIDAEMAQPKQAGAIGTTDLAELIQDLVRIELAGRVITTDQPEEGGSVLPNLEAFF